MRRLPTDLRHLKRDADEGIRHEILARLRGIPQMFATVEAQERRRVLVDGRWRIDFASCNYLGLDFHPDVMAAIPPALAEWGVHPSWTRAVASPRLYDDLERAQRRDGFQAGHRLRSGKAD